MGSFLAKPHPGQPAGTQTGSVDVSVDGLRIARVYFQVQIGPPDDQRVDCTAGVERLRTAFASYATDDSERVLARLQGMVAALPDLDIFLEAVHLRVGEDRRQRLETEIATRDRFFLFWSVAACRSPWVEFEWRTALRTRSLEYIAPVRLDELALTPPPADLASRHFGDWTRAVG